MYVKDLLLGPTCPLLDRTPSIEGGTINDLDIPGGVKSSLFCTKHRPQLVPAWVEVCVYSISLVRRH